MSLACNTLGEKGTKAICEALEQNMTLKELDLSGGDYHRRSNIGGAAGAKHVAKMLGVNGGLTSLNLSENQLCGLDYEYIGRGTYSAEGITAIADALRVNGALTMLSLAQNMLGEEGTRAICEALEQNKTLKELDISGAEYAGNIGGSAGAKHVAKMLGVNGGLTSLDLSNNALCGVTFMGGTYTAEGITAIAHALRVNGALTECDLIGNYMGEEGKASIRNAVQGKDGFKLHL